MEAKGAGPPMGFMGSLCLSHIESIFQQGSKGGNRKRTKFTTSHLDVCHLLKYHAWKNDAHIPWYFDCPLVKSMFYSLATCTLDIIIITFHLNQFSCIKLSKSIEINLNMTELFAFSLLSQPDTAKCICIYSHWVFRLMWHCITLCLDTDLNLFVPCWSILLIPQALFKIG